MVRERNGSSTRLRPPGVPLDPRPPGTLEYMVLMAVAGWGKEAEARSVYDTIVARTSRNLRLAAVYLTLERARRKEWVTVRTKSPRPGLGGWPRKIYSLTPEGARVLVDLAVRLEWFWTGAKRHGLVAIALRSRKPWGPGPAGG